MISAIYEEVWWQIRLRNGHVTTTASVTTAGLTKRDAPHNLKISTPVAATPRPRIAPSMWRVTTAGGSAMMAVASLLTVLGFIAFVYGLVVAVRPRRFTRKRGIGIVAGGLLVIVVGGSLVPEEERRRMDAERQEAERLERVTRDERDRQRREKEAREHQARVEQERAKRAEEQKPENLLRRALQSTLGGGNRVREIRVISETQYITIKWEIASNLTENLTKAGAQLDIKNILKAVRDSGVPYRELTVQGMFSFIDKLGNESESRAVLANYSRETVDRINFDRFLHRDVYEIASSASVHPAFRR
jgi:hypothetical protein